MSLIDAWKFSMKILYITQYFPPEAGATQTRAFENARYLSGAGHQVTVLCEIPNHPAGIVFKGYRGCLFKKRVEQGIQVVHVRVFASPKKNFITRLGFYFSFMAGAGLAGLALGNQFDAVYVTSPPLPAAAAGMFLARSWHIPLFFEVRDLWPDSAVALGELTNPWAVDMAVKLEQMCYARAKKVIAVTRGIEATLVHAKQVSGHKVCLIPNGATTDTFFYDSDAGQKMRRILGIGDHFVVLYAGILGIAQGLETLVAAAARIKQRHPDIYFLLAGAGPEKLALKALADRMGCDNICFAGEFAREQMPGVYAASDAALVPLVKNGIFTHARPSKMFDAWACEIPLLLGIAGEAKALLDQCGGGLFYDPQNAADLERAILEMKRLSWADRRKMGRQARIFVETCHSRQKYAQDLEKMLMRNIS
jgi:colanic acid biosynthesis glycosyl transferase WcaI